MPSWVGQLEPVYTNPAYIVNDTWNPGDHNLLGASLNPLLLTTAATASVTGKIALARVEWRKTQSVGNFYTIVNTVGATLTAGQNLMGIYTGAGVFVPGSTSVDAATAWTTAGVSKLAVSGGAITVPADPTGFIYVAILSNGTTPAIFRGCNGGVGQANIGLAAGSYAFGFDASTGNTSFPASVTPATFTQVNAFFAAVAA